MIGNNAIVLSKEEVGALNEAGEQGRYSVEVSLRLKQELYRALLQIREHEIAIQQAVSAGEQAIPWLVEWVARERGHLRFRAVEALKRLDKEKVIPYLLIKLNTVFDKDDEFFYLALEIAHSYRDPRIPQFILEQHGIHLRTGISDQLHLAALAALAEIGDRSHAPLLAHSLKILKRKVPGFREFWFPHVGCFGGMAALILWAIFGMILKYGREGVVWFPITSVPLLCFFAPAVGLLIWRHLRWIKSVSQLEEITRLMGKTFIHWGAVEGIGALTVLAADRLTSESATKPLFDLLGMLKAGDYVELSTDEREAIQKLLMAQSSDLQSRLISALPYLADALLFQWLEKQVAYAHLPGSVQRELMAVMPRIQSERHQRLAGMAEE